MRTVIIGYVDAPEGHAALRAAAAEVKARGGQLVVVHSSKGGLSLDGEDSVALKEALLEVTEDLDAHSVTYLIRNLVRGNDPADDLIDMADEYSAQLLVIGLRDRSLLGKLVLGSNATRILMQAPCPVLTVKAASN